MGDQPGEAVIVNCSPSELMNSIIPNLNNLSLSAASTQQFVIGDRMLRQRFSYEQYQSWSESQERTDRTAHGNNVAVSLIEALMDTVKNIVKKNVHIISMDSSLLRYEIHNFDNSSVITVQFMDFNRPAEMQPEPSRPNIPPQTRAVPKVIKKTARKSLKPPRIVELKQCVVRLRRLSDTDYNVNGRRNSRSSSPSSITSGSSNDNDSVTSSPVSSLPDSSINTGHLENILHATPDGFSANIMVSQPGETFPHSRSLFVNQMAPAYQQNQPLAQNVSRCLLDCATLANINSSSFVPNQALYQPTFNRLPTAHQLRNAATFPSHRQRMLTPNVMYHPNAPWRQEMVLDDDIVSRSEHMPELEPEFSPQYSMPRLEPEVAIRRFSQFSLHQRRSPPPFFGSNENLPSFSSLSRMQAETSQISHDGNHSIVSSLNVSRNGLSVINCNYVDSISGTGNRRVIPLPMASPVRMDKELTITNSVGHSPIGSVRHNENNALSLNFHVGNPNVDQRNQPSALDTLGFNITNGQCSRVRTNTFQSMLSLATRIEETSLSKTNGAASRASADDESNNDLRGPINTSSSHLVNPVDQLESLSNAEDNGKNKKRRAPPRKQPPLSPHINTSPSHLVHPADQLESPSNAENKKRKAPPHKQPPLSPHINTSPSHLVNPADQLESPSNVEDNGENKKRRALPRKQPPLSPHINTSPSRLVHPADQLVSPSNVEDNGENKRCRAPPRRLLPHINTSPSHLVHPADQLESSSNAKDNGENKRRRAPPRRLSPHINTSPSSLVHPADQLESLSNAEDNRENKRRRAPPRRLSPHINTSPSRLVHPADQLESPSEVEDNGENKKRRAPPRKQPPLSPHINTSPSRLVHPADQLESPSNVEDNGENKRRRAPPRRLSPHINTSPSHLMHPADQLESPSNGENKRRRALPRRQPPLSLHINTSPSRLVHLADQLESPSSVEDNGENKRRRAPPRRQPPLSTLRDGGVNKRRIKRKVQQKRVLMLKQAASDAAAERPFVCTRCKKNFRLGLHLRRHMQVHSEERNFDCVQCGKEFRNERQLQRHTNVHFQVPQRRSLPKNPKPKRKGRA